MKTILFVLFVCFLQNTKAATYYFSAVSGNDSRTAAQARNPSTPWKSLSKLNSFFSSLKPGDAVLLKRGETFYGSIIVKKSGTQSAPIVIGAYGSGAKPIITSLVTLSRWVSKGKGIWESYNSSLRSKLNNVLINNSLQQLGRYPNSDAPNKGYLTLESHTRNTITDNELTSAPNWTGAEVVIRVRRWVTDRCLITRHSGRTITYNRASSYAANDDYGYFIQNSIKTLNKYGEWYYNPSTKKLSVYFGAKNPASLVIQATTIENLISATGYSNVVFNNLNVKGANTDGFYVRSGSNMNISNCDISFSGWNGITVNYHDNLKIENCTVSNSNNNGIDLGYVGDKATIRNNKITNTSVIAGSGGNGDNKGIGIQSFGNGSIVEYNEIRNTGYIAIKFSGNYVTVKNNFVDRFCVTKDDGSGIYTHTGSANTNKYGRKVIGNIIMNGLGAPEGINDPKPAAEGIYMDDNTSGVEISNNTIANIPGKGIFLHNARGITITNNTVFNNEVQLCIWHDTKGNPVRNCTITNNNFFAKSALQVAADFKSIADDNNLIGRLDNNYYARPIDDKLVIQNSYVNSSGVRVNENLDLEGWKKKYNKDANSKRTAKQIKPYRIKSITGSNKIINGTFTSNINGITKTSCQVSWSKSGLLDGGYLQVTPSAKNSSVYMKIGRLTAGKKYILKYSVKGSVESSMTIGTFLRKDGSPYNTLTPTQVRTVSTVGASNEILFYSSSTQAAATVVFMVDNLKKYYLDNIQVYEADAIITNIDDSIRFEYNPTKVNRTVSLAGNYVDAKNNKYSNSIVLKPFESAVLIKDGSVSVANTAPTVKITTPAVKASYKPGATITINASASDADGSIKKVAFYSGTTLLHTEVTAPYSWDWKNVSSGKYTLTAKATDNSDKVSTSAGVSISVASSSYPTVSITSPKQNASYTSRATINISAKASDADGSIKKVAFYRGTTLLHTEVGAPYSWDWSNVTSGKYTITAKATDNSGHVSTSKSVTVSVIAKGARSRSSESNDTSKVMNNAYAPNLKSEIVSKEESKTYNTKVFPNPAVNKIHINIGGLKISNQKAKLSIQNLSGIIVKSIPVILSGKTIEADVSSLRTGIYIVSIAGDDFIISKKFVKN